MTRRSPYALVVGLACVLSLLLAGCVSMPDSGPVRSTDTDASSGQDSAVNINPRRPGEDDTPEEIVRGFLEAMTATPPIRTSVAREFLTTEEAAAWQPRQTIIYSTVQTERGASGEVAAVLSGADRTDSRGAWLGPLTAAESTLTFPVELQDNQWRITDAPDALIVPQSWFEQRFRQASLYFFDPTGSVLVPDPVFVPGGRQFASALVNGLLAGPAPSLAPHELTFLPPDLRSVVSVPVSADGTAQVDLTSDGADSVPPSPAEAELLVSQLAWTLRQDPAIAAFRVTIGGRPVQLPDQSTTFSVDHGHDYAPYVAGSSTQLFGLREGRMVGGSPQNLEDVSGPFGQGGYDLRAVAPDAKADRVAAVTSDGRSVLVGPVRDGGDPVVEVATGEDLLKPAWDFSDRLWLVDRRASGAAVFYRQDDTLRALDVPGVSGEDVKDFLVSRDGTRLVAVVRGPGGEDRLVVSRILTGGDGSVVRATDAVTINEAGDLEGTIRSIAWRSPTSVLVLHPVSRQLFQVRTASVDGAPDTSDAVALTLDRQVVSLLGTPVPGETLYALTRGSLTDLAGPRANALPIDEGVTQLDYAG